MKSFKKNFKNTKIFLKLYVILALMQLILILHFIGNGIENKYPLQRWDPTQNLNKGENRNIPVKIIESNYNFSNNCVFRIDDKDFNYEKCAPDINYLPGRQIKKFTIANYKLFSVLFISLLITISFSILGLILKKSNIKLINSNFDFNNLAIVSIISLAGNLLFLKYNPDWDEIFLFVNQISNETILPKVGLITGESTLASADFLYLLISKIFYKLLGVNPDTAFFITTAIAILGFPTFFWIFLKPYLKPKFLIIFIALISFFPPILHPSFIGLGSQAYSIFSVITLSIFLILKSKALFKLNFKQASIVLFFTFLIRPEFILINFAWIFLYFSDDLFSSINLKDFIQKNTKIALSIFPGLITSLLVFYFLNNGLPAGVLYKSNTPLFLGMGEGFSHLQLTFAAYFIPLAICFLFLAIFSEFKIILFQSLLIILSIFLHKSGVDTFPKEWFRYTFYLDYILIINTFFVISICFSLTSINRRSEIAINFIDIQTKYSFLNLKLNNFFLLLVLGIYLALALPSLIKIKSFNSGYGTNNQVEDIQKYYTVNNDKQNFFDNSSYGKKRTLNLAIAGRLINSISMPSDTLATSEIYTLSHFSKLKLVDLIGLVDPQVSKQGSEPFDSIHHRYHTDFMIYKYKPTYIYMYGSLDSYIFDNTKEIKDFISNPIWSTSNFVFPDTYRSGEIEKLLEIGYSPVFIHDKSKTFGVLILKLEN